MYMELKGHFGLKTICKIIQHVKRLIWYEFVKSHNNIVQSVWYESLPKYWKHLAIQISDIEEH